MRATSQVNGCVRVDDHRLTFRPEEALILHCARTEISPSRLEQVKALLAQPLDWEYLLSTARLHRVLPLVYWSLKRYCADQVPETGMSGMRHYSV